MEGDPIAQLVLERVSRAFSFFPSLLGRVLTCFVLQIYTPEVTVVEELEESVRDAGGFGSTGI